MRLGLLAAARITGPAIVEPAAEVDDVELVAVAARDLDRARQAAEGWHIATAYGTYAELIDAPDVDAVYIASPAAWHRPLTLAALAAGKHVLCEKPLAANAAEASEMVDAARGAGLILMEAFHWRYHPLVEQVAALLDDGVIGTIVRVDGCFDLPETEIPLGDIRWELALGGGALMDLGCYVAQWERWLLGEPAVVAAEADCPVAGIDGRMSAELVWPSGATGSLHCSMIEPQGTRPRAELVVDGTIGTMTIANPLAPQRGATITVVTPDGTHEHSVDRTSTYWHQLVAFRDAVATGTAPPTSGADSIATMELIDAIYRAAGMSPRPSLPR